MDTHSPQTDRPTAPAARLLRLWRWLTEPAGPHSETQRRRARLLSALLLPQLALGFIALVYFKFGSHPPQPLRGVLLGLVVTVTALLALAYGLNRVGRYRLGASLTVLVAALGGWSAVVAYRSQIAGTAVLVVYPLISVVLSSLLLPIPVTMVLAFAHLVGLLALPLLIPLSSAIDLPSNLVFVVLVSGLIILGSSLRERHLRQIEQQAERLAESEARFRSVVDYSAIGMSLAGLDGRWLQVNPALCAIVGYTESELLGMTFQQLTYPDDLEPDLENVRRLLAGEIASYQMQKRYFHKDGRIVWILLNVSVVRDPQGTPLHFISQIQDITERRQAEQQIRDAEAHFRTLVEQIPAITYMGLAGGEQHTLYISPQIETILGFTPQEWMADAELWRKQIHPEDRARVLAADEQSTATGEPFVAEYRIVTKDGRVRWLHDETHQVSDESGQPRFYLGLEFDVTERRETEEALRESTARYRQMFEEAERLRQFNAKVTETMAEGLAVEDADGHLTLVNPKLCAMLGYTAAELQSQNWSVIVAPGARAEVEAQAHLRLQGVSSTYEARLLTKDGREIPVLISAAPFAREGQYQGTVVTLVDISEQKRDEAALQEAKVRLESLVRQMEQRTYELAELSELGDKLQAARSLDDAYGVICDISLRLFPAASGALHLLATARNVLETAATWGVDAPPDTPFAPEECWAVQRGRPHLAESGHLELLCPHTRGATARFTLCVPLLAQSEVLGVFLLRSNAEGISAETQQLAQTVADRVSLALANLRLRESLRQQSIRDPLTNLFNRRYLEETLERETQRAARRGLPLGIIMLDIDHFKNFNDTFGHDAGDALLRELGTFLRLHIRQEDIPCRYGGEEFTLILPEASRDVTRRRADDLCQAAAHLQVQHAGRPLGTVTLSLGVAIFPDHGASGETVLHAADTALYAAKRAGRNRVAMAGE